MEPFTIAAMAVGKLIGTAILQMDSDSESERDGTRRELIRQMKSQARALNGSDIRELEDLREPIVLAVATPLTTGPFSKIDVPKYAKKFNLPKESVSHWALVVIRDEKGWLPDVYDLMSNAPRRHGMASNYPRFRELDSAHVDTWVACQYMGRTTRTEAEIRQCCKL
jgi:hypothetical protein